MKEFINLRQIMIGIVSLAAGAVVYLAARPPGSVYFIPSQYSLFGILPAHNGLITDQLPDFSHILAFSLITASVLRVGRRGALILCLSWFFVEVGFELGQHSGISPWLERNLPSWFDHVWLLKHTRSYFRYGTFDPFDLVAIGLGAVAAYAIILSTRWPTKGEA